MAVAGGRRSRGRVVGRGGAGFLPGNGVVEAAIAIVERGGSADAVTGSTYISTAPWPQPNRQYVCKIP